MPGKGLSSIFGMLPTQYVYGNETMNGAIMIMRNEGQNTSLIAEGIGIGQESYLIDIKNSGIDFSANFHEFSIEWDLDQIRWLVDNQQFHNQTLVRSFWSEKENITYTSI
jgi:beta-glucanase (GH16 family)